MKERIEAINKLLEKIGSLGRKFYSRQSDNYYKEPQEFSMFYLNEKGLYFYDAKEKVNLRANKRLEVSNGSTLSQQLEDFRQFILTGNKIEIYSKYWGYSYEDLVIIHELAKKLGICETAEFILHDYNKNKDIFYPGEKND